MQYEVCVRLGSTSPAAASAARGAPSAARAQVPVATSAAALTLEYEGYVVEPAIDFNQRSGYLSVAKAHDRCAFKGSYAFKEARPQGSPRGAPLAAARSGGPVPRVRGPAAAGRPCKPASRSCVGQAARAAEHASRV